MDDGRIYSKRQFCKLADAPSGIINDRSAHSASFNKHIAEQGGVGMQKYYL